MNRVIVNNNNNVVIEEFDGAGSNFRFELTPVQVRLLAEKMINAASTAENRVRIQSMKARITESL
jgi:hypothetical protein